MIVVIAWTHNLLAPDELLDIALPHWDRWVHVRMSLESLTRIREYLTSPAPRLETFNLSAYVNHHEPIDLFGGSAPSLQDITVCGARAVWDSEVFRGLRKLKLDTIENELISADLFLAMVSASPGLELLSIIDTKVGFTRLPPSSTRTPVQLPHLKSIILNRVCVETVGSILPFIRASDCDSFLVATFRPGNSFNGTDFLSRTFDHFDSLIRSTLAFRGSSQLYLLPDSIQWLCNAPGSDAPPSFSFRIPLKMNTSVPWISRFLGSELPKPAHELDTTVQIQDINAETTAGLKTLALLPNVRSFRMDYLLPSGVEILHLLGDLNKDARAHAFPRLKEFRLEGVSYGRPIQDLEDMLKRRYGELGQSVTGPPPMRMVLVCLPLGELPQRRLQIGDLHHIRTAHGVESLKLISDFGPEGMPACIYDDARRESCHPL
ncbi:hypothetical protein FRC05_002098 [Tulasnella sp. 425]|nr:hypothetical protein FRC05_002098 [Tulasnella sp. 425]